MFIFILCFLHFFLFLFSVSLGCFSSKAEDRLFRRLFRRYNQFIRPVENVSDPVTVEFEVSISQLVKVVRIESEQLIVFKQRNNMLYKSVWVIHSSKFLFALLSNVPFSSLQDEVNQIMETNLWLRHVSDVSFYM